MSFSSSTRPSGAGARSTGKAPVSGSNRLPSSRERRPALAALAVILILLGAAGSALIALRSGDRQDYVALGVNIAPGQKILEKNLARGDLAGKTGPMIPWSQRSIVVNKYATGWLFDGQYLTKDNVTAEPIPPGGALVGVTLEAGRAPSLPLAGGDIVQVVQVPPASQAGGASSIVVNAAKVMDVSGGIADTKTTNNTLNLTLLVPTSKSTTVAAAASAKLLVVVKLSSTTPPDVAPINGDG